MIFITELYGKGKEKNDSWFVKIRSVGMYVPEMRLESKPVNSFHNTLIVGESII